MLLLSDGNIHTTSVRGLLHEIIPTIPDATTCKQTPHTQKTLHTGSVVVFLILSVRFTLTKKPAQNGQDCLTRAEEVKAMLVKEKARTMAPRPRWHSPRYRSSRAPPGPRPDMPLRLSDQPRDPEADATLLESDGEGMLGSSACGGGWRRGVTLTLTS